MGSLSLHDAAAKRLEVLPLADQLDWLEVPPLADQLDWLEVPPLADRLD